jgi:hypothetical protein
MGPSVVSMDARTKGTSAWPAIIPLNHGFLLVFLCFPVFKLHPEDILLDGIIPSFLGAHHKARYL